MTNKNGESSTLGEEETKTTQINANIGKATKIRLTAEELCAFLAANHETILSKARTSIRKSFRLDVRPQTIHYPCRPDTWYNVRQ